MASHVTRPVKKTKVWKGEKRSGPAPARNIPWPEVFKHHISVIEGHTKMLEMLQKHTVKGTGNYETITNLVKRSYEMQWQAKNISISFIPTKNQRDMAPLGFSSESMYPGYSPAHIEYGKPTGDFGRAVGEMKARGEKWEPANGTEYEIGQSRGTKRKKVSQTDRTESTSSEEAAKVLSAKRLKENEPQEEKVLGFVVNTKPTPVYLPDFSTKRLSEDESEDAERKKGKRKKLEEDKEEIVPIIETEDISAEVDARLKAKEEKKKVKLEKKRRRESTDEDEEKIIKKPKKDKSRKRNSENEERSSSDRERKKKRKKNRDAE